MNKQDEPDAVFHTDKYTVSMHGIPDRSKVYESAERFLMEILKTGKKEVLRHEDAVHR